MLFTSEENILDNEESLIHPGFKDNNIFIVYKQYSTSKDITAL